MAAAAGDLEAELAVAADFLADHGFDRAADAVRVLYPRLPRSVLEIRRVFAALASPAASLSGWEIGLSFGVRPPARVPLAGVARYVGQDHGDNRTLGMSLRGLPYSFFRWPDGDDVFTRVAVVFAGEPLLSRPLPGGPSPVAPGDVITASYSVGMMDFLLPPKVVTAFVPDPPAVDGPPPGGLD